MSDDPDDQAQAAPRAVRIAVAAIVLATLGGAAWLWRDRVVPATAPGTAPGTGGYSVLATSWGSVPAVEPVAADDREPEPESGSDPRVQLRNDLQNLDVVIDDGRR